MALRSSRHEAITAKASGTEARRGLSQSRRFLPITSAPSGEANAVAASVA